VLQTIINGYAISYYRMTHKHLANVKNTLSYPWISCAEDRETGQRGPNHTRFAEDDQTRQGRFGGVRLEEHATLQSEADQSTWFQAIRQNPGVSPAADTGSGSGGASSDSQQSTPISHPVPYYWAGLDFRARTSAGHTFIRNVYCVSIVETTLLKGTAWRSVLYRVWACNQKMKFRVPPGAARHELFCAASALACGT